MTPSTNRSPFLIGMRIRELRLAQRIVPKQFATVRITRSHLWHIEHGRNLPGLSALERVASILDVSPARLFVESNGDLLLEDNFIRAIYRFARRLSVEQRETILKTLKAVTR